MGAADLVSVAEAPGGSVQRSSLGGDGLDDVLGGGLVAGSVVLVGGEPGVGKSTLVLQAAAALATSMRVLYVTGEESVAQLGDRAARLGLATDQLGILAERGVDRLLEVTANWHAAALIVDSIQTMAVEGVEGSAGGVSQVREAAARLIPFAKANRVSMVLVGHVTKEGSVAGPKLLEHMVDVVLYLDGEAGRLRVLRCTKNRFGPSQRVACFEMSENGLAETDPSAVFANRAGKATGSILFPTVLGRRAVLVEVQALLGVAGGSPSRTATGIDPVRLNQLLAVLERHAGLSLGGLDIHVALAGGLRVREAELDLPLVLAMLSSLSGIPLARVGAWGELTLTGEVRAGSQTASRVAECKRFGLLPIGGEETRIEVLLGQLGLAPVTRLTSVLASNINEPQFAAPSAQSAVAG